MLRIKVRDALSILYRAGFQLINIRGGSHAKLRHSCWGGVERYIVITGYNHRNEHKTITGEDERLLRSLLEKK